ncbi:hypothetical protein ACI6Q2_06965 [Chitinophagaceae bacterium LWZ2-11]
MENSNNSIPRIAVISVAAGLLLMAFFTMMWAGIAEGNLNGSDHGTVLVVFAALSLAFVVYAIYLFISSKKFQKISNENDQKEGKEMGKSFGLIFGIEGVAIPIAAFILTRLNAGRLVLPVIALIVGLHFYPMAKVFKRKVDYYLATWTCLIAVTGIVLMLRHIVSDSDSLAFIGIGVALATTSYGLYMLYVGYNMTKAII